jgi:hypothetical protein
MIPGRDIPLFATAASFVAVGFIGVRYVFEALAKVNRTDVALRMFKTKVG